MRKNKFYALGVRHIQAIENYIDLKKDWCPFTYLDLPGTPIICPYSKTAHPYETRNVSVAYFFVPFLPQLFSSSCSCLHIPVIAFPLWRTMDQRTNGSAFTVVYCSTNLSETRDFLTYTKLQRTLWYTHWIMSIRYGSMSSTHLWTHVWRVLDLRSPFRYLLGWTPSWITAVSISIQDNFRVYSYSLYLKVYWNWNWVLYYLLVHLQLTGYIKKTISLKPGVWMGKHIDHHSTDKRSWHSVEMIFCPRKISTNSTPSGICLLGQQKTCPRTRLSPIPPIQES